MVSWFSSRRNFCQQFGVLFGIKIQAERKDLTQRTSFLSLQDSGTVQIGNAEPVFEVVAYTPNGQHSTQRQGIFPKQARRNTLANQFGCFHDGNRLDERTPEHQRHCGVFGFLLQHFARTSKIKPFGLPNHVIACPQWDNQPVRSRESIRRGDGNMGCPPDALRLVAIQLCLGRIWLCEAESDGSRLHQSLQISDGQTVFAETVRSDEESPCRRIGRGVSQWLLRIHADIAADVGRA